MSNKDSGPAFPVGSDLGPASNICDGGYGGMSLRDWFAGQAMAGWLASFAPECQLDPSTRVSVAEDVYSMADAMLAERKEGEGDV